MRKYPARQRIDVVNVSPLNAPVLGATVLPSSTRSGRFLKGLPNAVNAVVAEFVKILAFGIARRKSYDVPLRDFTLK